MIEPYYHRAGVTIYKGDCLEIMPQLIASGVKVDAVVTDPPYDEKTHAGADRGFSNIDFCPLINVSALVAYCLSISHRWCIAFCSLEMLGEYKRHAGECWVRAGFWDRVSNQPQLSGDRPAQAGEGIAIFHRRGRKKWNGGGRSAIWKYPVERGKKQHPTQKPIALICRLFFLFTGIGENILDPFMGGGTTLVAAIRMNRKAIGIEIEPKYCEIAKRRCEEEFERTALIEPAMRMTQGELL